MPILDSLAAALGYTRPAAKAETGPGVVPMMNDIHMDIFGRTDQARITAAQALYHTNPWVNAAERAVTSKFANVDWHLEDEEDEEVDENSGPEYQAALDLLEHPQRKLKRGETQGLTRRALWSITSRHMGLCGLAHWYGDSLSLDGIPESFLYINPARLTPVSNKSGFLMGWRLDAVPHNPDSGYPLTLDEVWTFTLDPGDVGHYGIGLAEASGILGELWMLAAKHSGGVLSSGGRIAGITMPKAGVEMSDESWLSLVRDMRTISEDPNAAKRNLIVKKPIDFLPTAASPKDLDLLGSLSMSRDDILAYWGVPKSQIGMDVPSGLNSGSTKDRDLQVLWQGAVHSRLVPFAEVLQYQLLDRWMERGVRIELEIEEPDFTEDAPKFQNAATALSQPLRNRERRAILGLDPLGDPVLDEAVWMPVTMTNMFTAPDPEGNVVEEEEDEEEPTTIEVKARTRPRNRAAGMQRSMTKLRTNLDRSATPRIRSAVADVLDEQREEIIRKVRENAEHILAHPADTDVWWNAKKWDRKMRQAIAPSIAGVAESVTEHVGEVLSP